MPELIPCNQNLHATFALLQQGAAFSSAVNPLVTNAKAGGLSQITAIDSILLESLNPLSPMYGQDLTDVTNLKVALIDLVGATDGNNFSESALGQYLTWTNFTSGKSSSMPLGELSSLTSTIPGIALLTGATLLSVMSMTMASKQIDSELCEHDPEDPCATAGGIFGSAIGAFNTALQTILTFLNQMTNHLNNASNYITQIQAFVQMIRDKIAAEITKLAAMFLRAVHFGMAKLLTALGMDPCLQAVIGAIGTNQLKTALDIV